MADGATFDVHLEDDGRVKLRLDRPGVAAVSYTGDPREIIDRIASTANLAYVVADKGDADLTVEDAAPEA